MGIAIASGDLIRQKYRVERVLGEGGMGVVVAAWHLHLERRVALKFLLPEMLAHPGVVERFLREGRAASAIEGEHVAKVIDVDTLDDGTPYLVMEHLDGFDLATVVEESVEKGEELPVGRVVSWVIQACEAVAGAHRLGIVHRDLKPSNLFLATGRDGGRCIKVLDFGISKVAEESGKNLTRTSIGMGSAEYMSPEQCLSARDVDARTDVWALGVILYELLTLRLPYPGENATQVYALATTGPPDLPRALRPDIPEGLEAAILGCLQKDVNERIPTVAKLVEQLAPFAGTEGAEPGEPGRRGRTVVAGTGQASEATVPEVSVRRESATVAELAGAPGRRKRWPALAAGALALSLAAGAVILLTRRDDPPRTTPATATIETPRSPTQPVTATAVEAPPTAPASVAGPVVAPAPLAPASAATSASGAPAAVTSGRRSPASPSASTATKTKTYDPTKEM